MRSSSRTPKTIRRRAAVALTALLALGGAAGCTALPDRPPPGSAPATPPGESIKLLNQLTVATAASMRGYSRERFPHWRKAGTNCDVRDTVLRRDAEEVKLNGCNVVGGRWYSPYDDRTFTDPLRMDIDHVVPLANAWRSGAAGWDDKRRGDFANDLAHPQLIAVSASSNRAKGDQDPSQWKPLNHDYWCKYAQDWIAVKHFWRLSVTIAEKKALTDMLGTCRWPVKTP